MLKCNLNCILFDKADEGMYNHNIGVDSMIFCFKLTKGLYWGVVVPLSIILMLAVSFLIEKDLISYFVFFVVLSVGTRILQRLALKKYTEKNKVLDEKCDCESFRDWQYEMLSKKLKGGYKNLVELNLATAHYYYGDFQQMKQTLEAIDISRMNKRSIIYLYCYYRLWFLYHMMLSNMPEAEKVLSKIDSLVLPSDEKQKKHCENIVRISHLSVESKKFQVPDIEEKLKMIRFTDDLLAIVCEKSFLGKYYLRNGMRDEAKECFEFVAEHGNNLFIAKAAKEILKENLNKGEI